MSINLSAYQEKQFEAEVRHVFQEEGGTLRDSVMVKNCAGRDSVRFNVFGDGTLEERTSLHTPIPTSDGARTTVDVNVKNFAHSELTDIFLDNQTSVDERRALAKSLVYMANRRMDQLIIDALGAASITNTVADTIGGTADNLNTAMFREAGRLLGSKVPEEDRTFLCHDDGYHHLIGESEPQNGDTNIRKPLVDGHLPNWYGFDIKKIADRDEGGLPVPSANHRTNYAWQKMAVGLAVNMEPRVEVNYDSQYGAFRSTIFLSANAVVILPKGVVEITTDES